MSGENLPAEQPPDGQFLLYQTRDGQTRIECRFAGESIWLSQSQMAELFQVTVPTSNEHLKNLYEEGEIRSDPTIRKFRIVRQEGSRQASRQIDHYSKLHQNPAPNLYSALRLKRGRFVRRRRATGRGGKVCRAPGSGLRGVL
jgi:hypothetical protein